MNQIRCAVSNEPFRVDDYELELRKKLGVPPPTLHPRVTAQHLMAFWPHFSLHKRPCGISKRDIISVYPEDCPYPVWHREEWIKHSNPPQAEFDFSIPFFEQLWVLFRKCPIPHNTCLHNENCDYTDDWWYSKKCYLSHSGVENENCHYCYRILNCNDCQYAVFTSYSELCRDTVNSWHCFSLLYGFHCKNCRDSAFLFDCRNCQDCLFCWNLRNKQYCVENKQLTKSEYLKIKAQYDFSSRVVYERAKDKFNDILLTKAQWKALEIEKSEECSGAYLENCKHCHNCYFVQDSRDCANFIRGKSLQDSIDCICCFNCELVHYSAMAQDNCYDIKYCFNVFQSKFLEYCGCCFNCKNCFACCGLVGKEYCILNRQYSKEEYIQLVSKIRAKITRDGLIGKFFPAHFAPNSYDESLASFYFPLSAEEQERGGYTRSSVKPSAIGAKPAELVPDHAGSADPSICNEVFWDEVSGKPFKITPLDLNFSRKLNVPLPDRFYIRQIKELFSWMYFGGSLRETICSVTKEKIMTHLPPSLDGRIISNEQYIKQRDI